MMEDFLSADKLEVEVGLKRVDSRGHWNELRPESVCVINPDCDS